jgi:hypothetical protein
MTSSRVHACGKVPPNSLRRKGAARAAPKEKAPLPRQGYEARALALNHARTTQDCHIRSSMGDVGFAGA